jgi:hypothetical protein
LKRPDAYGGIIRIDGNPLEELKLLKPLSICGPRRERSIETIPFVMKDSNIYMYRNIYEAISMRLIKYVFIALVPGLIACVSVGPVKTENAGAANACEDPRPQVCTADYRPVCGALSDASLKTYSNDCSACGDSNVISWVEGECPK